VKFVGFEGIEKKTVHKGIQSLNNSEGIVYWDN
jgi:hypothetical protein